MWTDIEVLYQTRLYLSIIWFLDIPIKLHGWITVYNQSPLQYRLKGMKALLRVLTGLK